MGEPDRLRTGRRCLSLLQDAYPAGVDKLTYVVDNPHLERRNKGGGWEEVPFREGDRLLWNPQHAARRGRVWEEDIAMLWSGLEDGQYRLSYRAGADFDTGDVASGEFSFYTPAGLPPAG